jgi:peptide/nickel transport system substrate-binding protein
MDLLRGSRLLLVAAGALLAVLVLAGGTAAAQKQKPKAGGTATFGHDFLEPFCLNPYRASCFILNAQMATVPVLAGAFRQQPDFTFEPLLVDKVEVRKSPFSLTYRIEPKAEWSDGTPVSAHDLVFTRDTLADPENEVFLQDGYGLIVEATVLDAKTVRFVFESPFPLWKALFPFVLPKHAIEGHDFDTVWNDGIVNPGTGEPIGSGPYVLSSWVRGEQMTLTRNPNWWGRRPAFLDRLQVRFYPPFGQKPVAQALAEGEVDVIAPQATQPTLAGLPGIDFQSSPVASFEHVSFNVGSTTMPLLREQWFRQAVAYALDREGAAAAATIALGGPNHGVQQSLTFLSQEPAYRRHFARYSYDPKRVRRVMLRHGCALGDDGIWSCAGTRASLRLTTTTQSAHRSAAQAHLAAAAREAGLELIVENVFAGTFFTVRLPTGDFDLAIYSWGWNGDAPALSLRYGCATNFNFTRHCSDEVDDLLRSAEEDALSETRRRSVVNRADAILAEDLPSVPLHRRMTFMYSLERLRGLEDTATVAGPTWNAEEWWIDEE